MLLTAGARRMTGGGDPGSLPYPIPTSAPYNVPQHAITPTYDGSGNAVHPDVVDFWAAHGIAQWNGYRFWMAMTPYPNSNAQYENPSILASHDGLNWVVPPGLVNPIYPAPETGFYADTDLVYIPETDQLMCWWVHQNVHYAALSTDGVNWPRQVGTFGSGGIDLGSPAVVQEADGSWTQFGCRWGNFYRSKAAAPTGPWTNTVECVGFSPWHIDVIRIGDTYYAYGDYGSEGVPEASDGGYLATSPVSDGINWTMNPVPVIQRSASGWDSADLYRGTLQPHENGTHMRVWYSGRSGVGPANSWHVGLTLIPLAEWPA